MVDQTNIESSQKLSPDAEIVLYEIITREGASVYIKSGPEETYLGNTYESLPVSLTSEKRTADGDSEKPTFSIGGDDKDLGVLKPALFAGSLDGGSVVKHVVELEDLRNDVDQKITTTYRIKQVQDYHRMGISLILARFSPPASTTIPHVKYTRPAYPHVKL